MLFDQGRMEVVTIVTRDKSRQALYQKLKEDLKIQNKLDSIFQYLNMKVEDYFIHYEKQGLDGHLKAVYICGSDWSKTPIQEIYNSILNNKSDYEAFELSKQMIGCFLREIIIKSDVQYVCDYYPEKGYVYSR